MIDSSVYRTQRGALYRVGKERSEYFICFSMGDHSRWIRCVGLGSFPTWLAAADALDVIAKYEGWVRIGETVPNPTGHWNKQGECQGS